MNNAGPPPRRTIQELIVRYRLEPDLRDLYVEGSQDKRIYDWYFKETTNGNVSVFKIESVEVGQETLDSYCLRGGNRNRIIALALELDRQFPKILPHVRCLADSDFDFLLASRTDAGHLLYTDYTSVDMYTYNRAILGKVLLLVFDQTKPDMQSLMQSMSSTLNELFLIRASNEALDWRMRFVSFVKSCTFDGALIAFDRSDFLKRLLSSASKTKRRGDFDSSFNQFAAIKLDDERKAIHSEDYLELLGWYLNKRYQWKDYRRGKRSILPTLIVALDANLLSEETLFTTLDQIYR